MIINDKTWEFVGRHVGDDVRKLALQGAKDAGVDLPMALQQIAGRQAARRKLPTWAATEGILYPPHLNMEQCSSEQTARYKARLLDGKYTGGGYVDLTGGFGVDFYWMAEAIARHPSSATRHLLYYIEQNEELCALAEHNFRLLGLACSVCRGDASAYLAGMEPAAVVYLDPARRNAGGNRTYGIADCTPNVLELLPLLSEKAGCVILKLSPMLDWRKAVSDLNGPADGKPSPLRVSEVHIVSVGNECKELLIVLEKGAPRPLRLCCVNDESTFEVALSMQSASPNGANYESEPCGLSFRTVRTLPANYLYEPNASIMKAGCFGELCRRYPVRAVAANSHLFLSSVEIGDFPGRKFQISAISSMNRKELNPVLSPLKSANIAVRNFPMTAEQLRRKLKMKDGGDHFIFATTLADGQHSLFICRKIG